MLLPRISGEDPNLRFQIPSLRMATGPAPGTSSSGRKLRGVQEHSIHHRKQSAIRADAERKSQHRDRAESRVFPKHAKPIAHVLPETVHGSPPGNGRTRRARRLRGGTQTLQDLFPEVIQLVILPRVAFHSYRSATMGSTRIARRAGM